MTSNDDVPGSPGAGPAEECRGVTLEHEGGSGGEVERARERLRPDPERRARSQDRALDRDGQDWPGREQCSVTIIHVRTPEQRPISVTKPHVSRQ